MKTALVLGAGGFIGHHTVDHLVGKGYYVIGADIKLPEYKQTSANAFRELDLRDTMAVNKLFCDIKGDIDEVYQYSADMGGAFFIFTGENDAAIMHNSAMINLNVAEAAVKNKVKKLFYSSSACIYPQQIQESPDNKGLKESDAYPVNPDSEYGYEKIFSERVYDSYRRNHGLNIRVARFHNIFGEEGTYKGGREKAPAAICRKVSEAKDGTSIDIWGDGEQTRSFLHVTECITGVMRLMESDYYKPINIGSDEMISINKLTEMVIQISGKKLAINHIEGPQGVRGRNSDNTLIKEVLGWCPSQPLWKGMEKLYSWVNKQINH